PGLLLRPDLHSPPLPGMPKQEEADSGRDSLAAFASAKPETRLASRPLPGGNLMAKAMRLLQEMVCREEASRPRKLSGLKEVLDSRRAEQDLVQSRHPAAQARLQELQLRPVQDFPVPLERARRCSPSPGPCAFFQETLAARKCNRAARCGGRPIFARYRPPRDRR